MEKIRNWFERNIVLISILIWILTILLLLIGYREHLNVSFTVEPNLISPFGDFLSGFLGSTFGIITIYLVYKTYKSQKEELEASRNLIESQKIDSTFFKMLDNLNNFKANLEIFDEADPQRTYKGISFFKKMKDDFVKFIEDFDEKIYFTNPQFNIEDNLFAYISDQQRIYFINKYLDNNFDNYQKLGSTEKDRIKILAAGYKSYSSHYGYLFSLYFNTLNIVLDYLDRIGNDDFYPAILEAQLSQDELYHIYYYSLLSESFKEKVKRHKILRRLTYIELANTAVHTEFYAQDIVLQEVPTILI